MLCTYYNPLSGEINGERNTLADRRARWNLDALYTIKYSLPSFTAKKRIRMFF